MGFADSDTVDASAEVSNDPIKNATNIVRSTIGAGRLGIQLEIESDIYAVLDKLYDHKPVVSKSKSIMPTYFDVKLKYRGESSDRAYDIMMEHIRYTIRKYFPSPKVTVLFMQLFHNKLVVYRNAQVNYWWSVLAETLQKEDVKSIQELTVKKLIETLKENTYI